MPSRLTEIRIRNYRCLADVRVETRALNLLFGPNGAGKSAFLDTIWFVRDCAIRSVELASSTRSHGIGILYDAAAEAEPISITLGTDQAEYELLFGLSSGRIEPFAGERLYSKTRKKTLIDRRAGSDKASFYHAKMNETLPVSLREPEKLSMGRYLDFEETVDEAADLDRLLHFVHFHHSRSFFLYRIKQRGSEVSHETWLWERGDNLFSVLRNLQDRKSVDDRFDTIMQFMKESFPSFDGLLLEQVGASDVYASFLEKGRRKPIRASGVSDGHLQMLLLLTALFAEGRTRPSLLILDEPEISLHPWALAVFAKAATFAANDWNKQIFIATHSPVLMSQFAPDDALAAEIIDGRTRLRRLSDIQEVRDLLEQYAAGSLYISEMVAPQSKSSDVALRDLG